LRANISTMNKIYFFIQKRVVLKDCVHSENNGMTTIITNAQYNDVNEIILCTEIKHPEDETTFLWVNASQVAYIKEFDHYLNQYMDKSGKCVNSLTKMSNIDLKLVGQFDIYLKVYI